MDNPAVEDLEEWLSTELDHCNDINGELDGAFILTLPESLELPVRIKWIMNEGSTVVKDQTIAIFIRTECEENSAGNGHMIDSGCATNNSDAYQLKSLHLGKLEYNIKNKTIINDRNMILGRINPSNCRHEVIVHNLCAACCEIVLQPDSCRKRLKQASDNTLINSTDKKTAGFISNDSSLMVDVNLLQELEAVEMLKLLENRKLCLVLDLDNTLIHASSHKPPIDMDINILHVQCDDSILGSGAQYATEDDKALYLIQKKMESSILYTQTNDAKNTVSYFKLRPGVFKFLQSASNKCDLYLFTMGTSVHAKTALNILDPQSRFFANRIFSRGDTIANMKCLERIFPTHSNLIIIMDDSEHAWACSSQLIKVHPYCYFADFSFASQCDIRAITRWSASLQAPCMYSNFHWQSLLDFVSKNSKQKDATSDVSRTIDGFMMPKVINKVNPILTRFQVTTTRPDSVLDNKQKNSSIPKISVIDSDMQLMYMTDIINKVHSVYYKEYDMLRLSKLTTGSLLQLLQQNKLPTTSNILKSIMLQILNGVKLYIHALDFVYNNSEFDDATRELLGRSDITYWSKKLGAVVTNDINKATHVLINNPGQLYKDKIKVPMKWFEAALYTWQRPCEDEYNAIEPIRSFWDIVNKVQKHKL